jgi:hypothetical protein
MRLIATLFLSTLCASVYPADQTNPHDLQALPPPSLDSNETVDEPQITINKQTEQTVEEYRVGGRLYMIKITPRDGAPYYLVDDMGNGKFSRQEGLDLGVRPPRWVFFRF